MRNKVMFNMELPGGQNRCSVATWSPWPDEKGKSQFCTGPFSRGTVTPFTWPLTLPTTTLPVTIPLGRGSDPGSITSGARGAAPSALLIPSELLLYPPETKLVLGGAGILAGRHLFTEEKKQLIWGFKRSRTAHPKTYPSTCLCCYFCVPKCLQVSFLLWLNCGFLKEVYL